MYQPQEKKDVSQQICKRFKELYKDKRVRFGRTSKITKQFIGIFKNISWEDNNRKGGGYVLHILYKGKLDSHHIILGEMLNDYTRYIQECIKNGELLKPIKNHTTNPSKDLEFYVNGDWIPYQTLFPIETREMKNIYICRKWITESSIKTDNTKRNLSDIQYFTNLLKQEYELLESEYISHDLLSSILP